MAELATRTLAVMSCSYDFGEYPDLALGRSTSCGLLRGGTALLAVLWLGMVGEGLVL